MCEYIYYFVFSGRESGREKERRKSTKFLGGAAAVEEERGRRHVRWGQLKRLLCNTEKKICNSRHNVK